MTKTTVSKHVKERKSGRFDWKRHEREIERIEKDMRSRKLKSSTKEDIESRYLEAGYIPPRQGMAAKHGADSQWVKQNEDGTQDHSRIYDKKDEIEVEEHTDIVSPESDVLGHVVVDVGEVTYKREIEGKNENRTKRVKITKEE